MKTSLWKSLLTALVVLAISVPASAAITLYDNEGTTFSTDGSFNTFYVYSTSDNEISGVDHDQSRVKMGFLPNWIGFNFSKQAGNLKLGGRSSFWVNINDSEHPGATNGGTDTGIDVRQFYGTVDGDWGQVLFGKDFTLFSRSNIFLDEILLGYGNVSDTIGLIDGGGVSFGNIGTGYIYPMPAAQITYRTPDFNGFKLAIGLIDPARTASNGEEQAPRLEGEATYKYSFDGGAVHAWAGFLTQSSEDRITGNDVDSNGVSYGVQLAVGNARVHASGFTADGVGFLLNPGIDAALAPVFLGTTLDNVDSDGYLFQGAYILGPARLVASYGKTEVDDFGWEDETITGACFYSVNANLTLVAEYNVNTISIGSPEEETKTIALGAIVNF
jgi:predicted porin